MISHLEFILNATNIYLNILKQCKSIVENVRVLNTINARDIAIREVSRRRKILINEFIMKILEAEQFKIERVWTLIHSSTFWEIDCQENGERFFKEHFRMVRSSFNKLCNLLKAIEKKNTRFRDSIPLEKRVAIAVYALGSASEYKGVAGLFGVGKSTVGCILIDFCKHVWFGLFKYYFPTLPFTEDVIRQSVDAFNRMGFPQCIGALDGCHIEVHPKKDDATDYYNYKGWYSVVLMALVDYRYKFLYINVGSPGRCNDSSIFESSALKHHLESSDIYEALAKDYGNIKVPVFCIGDSAFRLTKFMMKPYPFELQNTAVQKKFNYRLSKCRRVVENAFGHLKARFRRIGKGIDNHMQNVNVVISSACVLHNFLKDEQDDIADIWLQELYATESRRRQPNYASNLMDRERGKQIRRGLTEYFAEEDVDARIADDGFEFIGVEDAGRDDAGEGESGPMSDAGNGASLTDHSIFCESTV